MTWIYEFRPAVNKSPVIKVPPPQKKQNNICVYIYIYIYVYTPEMPSERMRSWIRKFELSSTVIYSRCRMPTARQRNQCPIRGNLANVLARFQDSFFSSPLGPPSFAQPWVPWGGRPGEPRSAPDCSQS